MIEFLVCVGVLLISKLLGKIANSLFFNCVFYFSLTFGGIYILVRSLIPEEYRSIVFWVGVIGCPIVLVSLICLVTIFTNGKEKHNSKPIISSSPMKKQDNPRLLQEENIEDMPNFSLIFASVFWASSAMIVLIAIAWDFPDFWRFLWLTVPIAMIFTVVRIIKKIKENNINETSIAEEAREDYLAKETNHANKNIQRPKYLRSDGIGYEQYCKYCLENIEGFYNVKTTRVTGDYGADLTAKKEDDKYVIQCKNYDGSVSPHAVQEVLASMRIYGATKAMVITNSYLTPEAKQIAKANGVIVWEHYGENDIISYQEGQIYF